MQSLSALVDGREKDTGFEASARFAGWRGGWVFKTASKGLGYYQDVMKTRVYDHPSNRPSGAKGRAAPQRGPADSSSAAGGGAAGGGDPPVASGASKAGEGSGEAAGQGETAGGDGDVEMTGSAAQGGNARVAEEESGTVTAAMLEQKATDMSYFSLDSDALGNIWWNTACVVCIHSG